MDGLIDGDVRPRLRRMAHAVASVRSIMIADIEAAKAAGATEKDLAEARKAQRRGQFYVDFVESENSNGFHAPQEATRILGDAIDLFRKGQVSLWPLKWAAKPLPRPPAD